VRGMLEGDRIVRGMLEGDHLTWVCPSVVISLSWHYDHGIGLTSKDIRRPGPFEWVGVVDMHH